MKESDIRPADIFAKYLELSAQDAQRCFKDSIRSEIPCPGCARADNPRAFEKSSFIYRECSECRTLYQSPRVSLETYEAFYRDSVSTRFWAKEFFPRVLEARRAQIFQPRVEKIKAFCDAHKVQPSVIIDVGAGFGVFLEEWEKRFPQTRAIAVEPSKDMAARCRNLGFEVIEDMAEHVKGHAGDLVVCFELLEHVYDPLHFVKTLNGLVKPGGYLLMTTLGVDGFDIQVLWEKSKSISPPHHINFFSRKGFRRLCERAGLTDVAITTPGFLDVDIIRNMYREQSSVLDNQRFVKQLMEDEALAGDFQKFLQEHVLSSHTWVWARKPV